MTTEQTYPIVTEVLKITDTEEGNGVYKLDVKIQFAGDQEPETAEYLSRPDDPYGVNPQIRKWMSENPDLPVHEYEPPTPEEIRANMPRLMARQLRLNLVKAGFSPTQIDAAIDEMPDGPDKDAATIEWEYGTIFERLDPLTAIIAGAISYSDEQMDEFWIEASLL